LASTYAWLYTSFGRVLTHRNKILTYLVFDVCYYPVLLTYKKEDDEMRVRFWEILIVLSLAAIVVILLSNLCGAQIQQSTAVHLAQPQPAIVAGASVPSQAQPGQPQATPQPVQPVFSKTGLEEDVMEDIFNRLRWNGWQVYALTDAKKGFSLAKSLRHPKKTRRMFRLTISVEPYIFYHFTVIEDQRLAYYVRHGPPKEGRGINPEFLKVGAEKAEELKITKWRTVKHVHTVDKPIDLTQTLVEIKVDTRSRNVQVPLNYYYGGNTAAYGQQMRSRLIMYKPPQPVFGSYVPGRWWW